MATILDDKSEHCVPFILDHLKKHRELHEGSSTPPFIVGLNGVQGAGKTTLVTTLQNVLSSEPHSLSVAVLSIDDLYLTHEGQKRLARAHPDNPLVQHRGQPSTHEVPLGAAVFAALREKRPTKIPHYDKSAFNGEGDRAPVHTWKELNRPNEQPVEIVLFEGWCVGFKFLNRDKVRQKWELAVEHNKSSTYDGQLGKLQLDSVNVVNNALLEYDDLTEQFNIFIHIDAENPIWVYQWRLEAERALRASRGSAMTDEQVKQFVNGYYPAYELYTDVLRAGIFPSQPGRQLRIVIGEDRKVKSVEVL